LSCKLIVFGFFIRYAKIRKSGSANSSEIKKPFVLYKPLVFVLPL